MSAFIVDKAHIDAMVAAGLAAGRRDRSALRWRIREVEWTGDGESYSVAVQAATRELRHDTADRVGAMLWNENKASVDHRYNEANDREVYTYPRATRVLSPVQILKAISCYEYQSCEHDAWATSEAKAFCESLRRAMIYALPGYDDAEWEIMGSAEMVAREEG